MTRKRLSHVPDLSLDTTKTKIARNQSNGQAAITVELVYSFHRHYYRYHLNPTKQFRKIMLTENRFGRELE